MKAAPRLPVVRSSKFWRREASAKQKLAFSSHLHGRNMAAKLEGLPRFRDFTMLQKVHGKHSFLSKCNGHNLLKNDVASARLP